MIAPNDGGPIAANITHQTRVPGEEGYVQMVELFAQGGLSIRDWFAGMAMQGGAMYVNEHEDFYTDSLTHMAEASYRIADAMLAARDKPET